jgi:hypothetical protein
VRVKDGVVAFSATVNWLAGSRVIVALRSSRKATGMVTEKCLHDLVGRNAGTVTSSSKAAAVIREPSSLLLPHYAILLIRSWPRNVLLQIDLNGETRV